MSLIHFIQAGGFVMYPLLVLSLVAVVVIIDRIMAYRLLGGLAPGLLDETIKLCKSGNFAQAAQACESRPGPLAASLSVIMAHRKRPVSEVERMVEETGQEFFIRLEQRLSILDTTTTISPLLGLLGTIVGMIGTFNAIATQQGKGNTDGILAGVGEALYATATGISIAVVCFIAYNYFAARLTAITSETAQSATKLLNALTDIRHQEAGVRLSDDMVREEAGSHGI